VRPMRVFDQWRRNRGQVGFVDQGSAAQNTEQSIHQPSRTRPRHHGTAASTDPGVALNRGPRVRLWSELGRHRFDPLRRPMCGGMRRKGQHSPFFGPPIFSALRSATCAPIPRRHQPPHCRTPDPACSIHWAGQHRLEKAADALKVSWGLFSLRNQPTKTSGSRWGPKLGQVLGTFSFPLRARALGCSAPARRSMVYSLRN